MPYVMVMKQDGREQKRNDFFFFFVISFFPTAKKAMCMLVSKQAGDQRLYSRDLVMRINALPTD